MELTEIAGPIASTAVGGITVGGIAKVLIQNWIKRNDTNHERWQQAIQQIMIAITRLEENVKALKNMEERHLKQIETAAVLSSQVEKLSRDVNGLGGKFRNYLEGQ
jgi:SMC interacting uncharacterized protein involved in chromosome segregation